MYCQSSVDYGNTKVTSACTKSVCLHNAEIGHYTEDDDEEEEEDPFAKQRAV